VPELGWRGRSGSSSEPPSLRLEKLSQPSRIRAELVPSRPEPPHAILAIPASALGVALAHRDHGVDGPSPMLGTAAAVLDADRADLDLEAVIIEEDAVVVDRLGVKDFAEM
jgi:hypothetical protein